MLFKKTTDHNHEHLVLIDEENGQVTVIESEDHIHQPGLIPDEQGIDPSPIIINGVPMTLFWDEEIEDHVHGVKDIKKTKSKWVGTDEEEFTKQTEKYKDANEIESDSIESGIESEGFVVGGNFQWDRDVFSDRTKAGKPTLSINVMQPMVDTMMGMFLQNKTDFKCYPSEEGDELIASILSRLLKHVSNISNLQYQDENVFKDGIIAGRGCFVPYIDYKKSAKGEVTVKSMDWKSFRFGPHKEKDLSDCPYVFIQKWLSKEEVEVFYDIDPSELGILDDEHSETNLIQGGHKLDPNAAFPVSGGGKDTGEPGLNQNLINDNMYLLLERREKVYKSIPVLITDNDSISLEGYKGIASKLKNIDEYKIINKIVERVKIVITVGSKVVRNELLSEQFSDLFIVPFYAHKTVIDKKNIFYGKVEQAKLPQQEINLRHCQLSMNVSGSSNNKYFYDTDTFVNENDRANFIRNAHRANGVFRVADSSKPPVLEPGAKLPTGAAQMLETDLKLFRQITNVNLESLAGSANTSQSGVAIMQKKQTAMVGNEIIFSNFNMAKTKLGNLLVKLMQDVYADDPERIYRILKNDDKQNNFQLPMNGQDMNFKDIPMDYILDKLQDVDLLKYDVVVDLSQQSQSAMMQNYLLLSELMGKGIPIPMEHLIKNLPIPEKDQIINQLKQQQMQPQMQVPQNQ